MNARHPFLTLLKHELGAGQAGGAQFFLGLVFFQLPWLGLSILMSALGRDLTAFYPGMLGVMLLFWLLGMCALTTYPQVPLVWSNMTNFKQFEFLFTRAVDRRLDFRAKAAAVLIFVLVPQFPGFLWSVIQPDMRVTLDARAANTEVQSDTVEGRIFPTTRYFQAFPGSERVAGVASGEHEHLRIRSGWLAYSGWLACVTVLLMAMAFAYYALVGQRLRVAGWWANTVLVAPVPVVIGAVLLAAWCGVNPGDELLLFYGQHWFGCLLVAVGACYVSLRWCERRFVELEIV